ncbi:hypothetical protein HSR121_2935 [Halapricum desulfuricans]|uniref:Uncharacterized protein n=1 Tax=Halapricum desulfuricans TaxID=2841257 RepID=A0A897N2P8_9EURY|nr:hypothetical protein HSR121_2935 [Halapricum desulfuricans]
MELADLPRERLDVQNQDVWENEWHADTRTLFRGSTSLDGVLIT